MLLKGPLVVGALFVAVAASAGVILNDAPVFGHAGDTLSLAPISLGNPSAAATLTTRWAVQPQEGKPEAAAGLDTHGSTNIRLDMWKKLLGNIGLSATSGTTDLASADMIKIPELAATIHRAVNEAAAVAVACGVAIPEAEKHEILEKLTSTSAGTGDAKSSLCADLRAGRPTEIDWIYGTVVRFGKEHGVPTPTLDTLIAIVRGLESHYI